MRPLTILAAFILAGFALFYSTLLITFIPYRGLNGLALLLIPALAAQIAVVRLIRLERTGAWAWDRVVGVCLLGAALFFGALFVSASLTFPFYVPDVWATGLPAVLSAWIGVVMCRSGVLALRGQGQDQ